MGSVKEIILALTILVGGGFAIKEIHYKVRSYAIHATHKGLKPLSIYTGKMSKVPPKRIEQGYLE